MQNKLRYQFTIKQLKIYYNFNNKIKEKFKTKKFLKIINYFL